jgi:hypothetical protein
MNGTDLEATLARLRPSQMKDALTRVWAMDPDVFLRALGATLADHGDPLPLTKRVEALEADTPQARQLRYEADLAIADAREFEHHGRACGCPYCGTDDDEALS